MAIFIHQAMSIRQFLFCTIVFLQAVVRSQAQETFPNGEEIAPWFADTTRIDINTLGEKYVITDYGVCRDSTILQTEAIQRVIDLAAARGGGVIVVPQGTFLSASLFFRQGTHLHLCEGAVIKGIDEIKYYPIVKTRLEGQTLNYFAALINADGLDNFTISGQGTIDGNGKKFWEEFWLRFQLNSECTNLEALRPRLVYISNCTNIQVQDVRLINSPFWTNHLYHCDHVKYIGCYIFAPTTGVKAPSSDAIDIDYCHDILVSGCYMSVNDDAVVLKGGKGTYADQNPDNGPNYNIIVSNCTFGRVHGCLTLGSESLHDWNIILRHSTFSDAQRVLWLKMRPDTPQHYEQILLDTISGDCESFIVIRPWTQFFAPQERDDMPLSQCNDICIRNVNTLCERFFDIGLSEKYSLSKFSFVNCDIIEKKESFSSSLIPSTTVENVTINGHNIE